MVYQIFFLLFSLSALSSGGRYEISKSSPGFELMQCPEAKTVEGQCQSKKFYDKNELMTFLAYGKTRYLDLPNKSNSLTEKSFKELAKKLNQVELEGPIVLGSSHAMSPALQGLVEEFSLQQISKDFSEGMGDCRFEFPKTKYNFSNHLKLKVHYTGMSDELGSFYPEFRLSNDAKCEISKERGLGCETHRKRLIQKKGKNEVQEATIKEVMDLMVAPLEKGKYFKGIEDYEALEGKGVFEVFQSGLCGKRGQLLSKKVGKLGEAGTKSLVLNLAVFNLNLGLNPYKYSERNNDHRAVKDGTKTKSPERIRKIKVKQN